MSTVCRVVIGCIAAAVVVIVAAVWVLAAVCDWTVDVLIGTE